MAYGAHEGERPSPARAPRWAASLLIGVASASAVELLALIAVESWLPDGLVLLLANLAVLGALRVGALRTGGLRFGAIRSGAIRSGARSVEDATGTAAGPVPDPARAPLGTRFATAVLGWCLGALIVLLAATPDTRAAQWIAAAPLLLLAIPTPWSFGFSRSGAIWGRRHWIGYGIASLAVLIAAPLVPHAGEAAAPLAFGLGIAATLPLIAVAFLRPLTEADPRA